MGGGLEKVPEGFLECYVLKLCAGYGDVQFVKMY